MPDEDDETQPLVAQRALTQGSIIPRLLRAETQERRDFYLDALRAVLPPKVRVYYSSGLHVYYDHDPSRKEGVYPFGRFLSHAATHIEEVMPNGGAHIRKGVFGPLKIPHCTEPKPPSIWDVLQGDEYD